MKVIGFQPEEIQTVYKILGAILHLVSGNASQNSSPPCGTRMFFQKVWGFVKSNLRRENSSDILKKLLYL